MPSRCRSRKGFLSENFHTLERKIITWPVTGLDRQSRYADMPWLDTGIESRIVIVDLLNTFDIRMPQVVM